LGQHNVTDCIGSSLHFDFTGGQSILWHTSLPKIQEQVIQGEPDKTFIPWAISSPSLMQPISENYQKYKRKFTLWF